MSPAVILVSLALAGPASPSAKGTRFEQGQKAYNQGDFEGALKQLDLAAQDEREPALLEKIHLLRGQCFSARQDFVRAEDAFALALDANPDASLDPARVDPTVVKLLDAVRARLTATLVINSTPTGASLFLDGKNFGVAPQTNPAPIGKHKLEARWGEGPMTPVELVLRPKKETRVEFVQGQAPPPVIVPVQPDQTAMGFYGDLRFLLDIPTVAGAAVTPSLEGGGGLSWPAFRLGLLLRFPLTALGFGVVVRGSLHVSLTEKVRGFVEASIPLLSRSGGIGFGFGVAGGGEFHVLPWFSVFAQIGGQYLPINTNRADNGSFTPAIGVRLRPP